MLHRANNVAIAALVVSSTAWRAAAADIWYSGSALKIDAGNGTMSDGERNVDIGCR
jgi:hypothetical protein